MTYNVFSGTLNPAQSMWSYDDCLEDKIVRTVLCCLVYNSYITSRHLWCDQLHYVVSRAGSNNKIKKKYKFNKVSLQCSMNCRMSGCTQ